MLRGDICKRRLRCTRSIYTTRIVSFSYDSGKSDGHSQSDGVQNQSDPKIQIKYVDTKNQLADLLTKASHTRDEWSNLLRLFNIMNSSMFSRSHFRSIEKENTMSKIIQERKTGVELAAAKPRPTCFISRILLNVEQASSLGSDASNVSGIQVCFRKHMETCARQKSKSSNVFYGEEGR